MYIKFKTKEFATEFINVIKKIKKNLMILKNSVYGNLVLAI